MRSGNMLPADLAETARRHFESHYGLSGDDLEEMLDLAAETIFGLAGGLTDKRDDGLLHEMKGVFLNAGMVDLAALAEGARGSLGDFVLMRKKMERILAGI